MQCADLKLFEFKAHGVGGVPNFSVALRAPAALANNYALTMPGAVPGAQALVQVDSAGQLIFSNTLAASQDIKHGTRTLQIGHTLFQNTGAALTYGRWARAWSRPGSPC